LTGTTGAAYRSTVQRLRDAGIEADEARLEAEVLLRHVLRMERSAFLARRDDALPTEAASQLARLLERRCRHEPLAYILGHRAFYGLDFAVDERVLIPRPETEGLVERVIALAGKTALIVDAGTGSGCIALALAAHLPDVRVIATDASADALALAAHNAYRLGLSERIAFLCGDLLEPVREKVDIIVSNPPYIPSGEIAALAPEIAHYEPRTALDGGPDGLDVVRRLLAQAVAHLRPGGHLLLEIGTGQGTAVARLAGGTLPESTVEVENDLAGLERYVVITLH
jgi:release factor glutamine methyltransferase